ncbi:MAG: glycosyltransferase [Muribaculaceae bacterium]|nr:glycosyltransferase [Muribaculaceae bacterium]
MKFQKKEEIRITVLMAIYNCASTLEEALDSLMNQTYQGFRVILCDDCSKDNTYEVAEKYINRYPDKFILLRNERNMKLPATLNRCLEYADTEYVARMDGDDISKPERFEKEIQFLDAHPEFALVSCPMEYFDENGVFMTGKPLNEPQKKDFILKSPHAHAPVMIRTSILREVHGYTVEKWTERGQDIHLWAKIYNRGYKGYNLSEPLYGMRDDKAAFKRRNLKSAFYNVKRAYEIYKLLDIPKYYLFYEGKGFLIALSPKWIYDIFHKK